MHKPGKEPLRRKEEPLEVGLARHEKTERSVPSWLIEYGAWIVLGSFLVFVVAPLVLLGRQIGSGPSGAGEFALLSVSEAPTKVWVEGASSELRSVQIAVTNTGPSTAQSVKVSVAISGTKYTLLGPAQIESGKSGRFAGAAGAVLRPEQELSVQVDCSNCRRE
jgi:hypothetical protein